MPDKPITGRYRILHCIDSLGVGGAETQFVKTLLNLNRTHFEHIVCYLTPPSNLEKRLTDTGLNVINLNIGKHRRWFAAIRRLRRLIKQYDINLVHASTAYSNIYAPLAARLEGIPIVFTLTNDQNARVRSQVEGSRHGQWRIRNFFLWRGLILRLTGAQVIAISNGVKESAVKDLGIASRRIEVIYRGLVPEEYLPKYSGQEAIQNIKIDLGLNGAYPILINTARLWPQKGQRDLVRAMPFILRAFPNARLLIAGIGPLQKELELIRDQLGLKDNVTFLGLRSDIPLLLSASDIFVTASYFEGLSNAVTEAMAAGRPVVAFDIPVFREILREQAGSLVQVRDPERLASAIVELASDPKTMQVMGGSGIRIVRDDFDIRKNTKKLESIYDLVLSNRNRPRNA